MTKSNTLVIRSGERLALSRDLSTDLLIVHLGAQPVVIERNGSRFDFDDIELIGVGSLEIRNGGKLDRGIQHTSTSTTFTNGDP